jgi:hypothetical protein
MNEFERRWKLGTAAARHGQPALSDEAPFGFAARVVARWQAQPEPSFAALWQALAWRVLGTMTLVLLILVTYGAISSPHDEWARPEIEDTVADSLVLL